MSHRNVFLPKRGNRFSAQKKSRKSRLWHHFCSLPLTLPDFWMLSPISPILTVNLCVIRVGLDKTASPGVRSRSVLSRTVLGWTFPGIPSRSRALLCFVKGGKIQKSGRVKRWFSIIAKYLYGVCIWPNFPPRHCFIRSRTTIWTIILTWSVDINTVISP